MFLGTARDDISSQINKGRATGPDHIESTLAGSNTLKPYNYLTHAWINGDVQNPNRMVSDVKLITLSKKGKKLPPAQEIRPIGVNCLGRKYLDRGTLRLCQDTSEYLISPN